MDWWGSLVGDQSDNLDTVRMRTWQSACLWSEAGRSEDEVWLSNVNWNLIIKVNRIFPPLCRLGTESSRSIALRRLGGRKCPHLPGGSRAPVFGLLVWKWRRPKLYPGSPSPWIPWKMDLGWTRCGCQVVLQVGREGSLVLPTYVHTSKTNLEADKLHRLGGSPGVHQVFVVRPVRTPPFFQDVICHAS